MQTNQQRNQPSINVTPLIDVLLVLLIIFMVISPLRPSQFSAQLPEKMTEAQPVIDQSALVVTVKPDGSYLLNQQPAANALELGNWLSRALDGRPADRKSTFVKAPRGLPYGAVVKAIDVMKGAGAAPIGLQLENLE